MREAGIGVWFCGNATSEDKPLTNIDDMLKVHEMACLVPNAIAYNTYIRELGGSPCRLVVFDNSLGFRYRDAALYYLHPEPSVLYIDLVTSKQMLDGTLLTILDEATGTPSFRALHNKLWVGANLSPEEYVAQVRGG